MVKKFKEEQTKEVERLFHSIEDHTRKMVQMNSLARNFVMKLALDAPAEFGQTFSYTKVYLGKLSGECVTLESYLNGTFEKYINNTGDISGVGSELSMKAESAKQLMIVDIQGVNYALCDPEIASTTLMARDETILFCSGNLSTAAIEVFLSKHTCNKFCQLLKLDQK